MEDALVLLHGFTGSPRSFEPLLSELKRGPRPAKTFAPLLLGHGPRPAGGECLRFEQEVDRLAQLVKRRGLSGAHLCGYSLGARLALGLLARHAYLFASATLVSVHTGLGDADERAARVGSDERWCALLARAGTHGFLLEWEAQPLFGTQRGLPAHWLERQRAIRNDHQARGLARALRVLGLGQMPNYAGALRSCPIRTTLVVGALDAKFLAHAQRFGAPGAEPRLEVVEGTGHNVPLEAPGQLARVLTSERGA